MKAWASARKENIINNIKYIIKSRGETKASFATRTGVTRSTLYKILDGRINNVHHATVTRIADFFGVSCEIIENHNLENIELIEKSLSPDGNKNPAAVPVIPQSDFLSHIESRIGSLVTQYPLTWFFGDVSNMVALLVEENIGDLFLPGDTLIIRRKYPPENKQLALFISAEKRLFVRKNDSNLLYHPYPHELFIGTIMEERVQ